MRVLIAEDDVISRRLLEVMFSQWGYEVVGCSDGAEAWAVLQADNPPSLAVLDWMMPEIDGTDLCRSVRMAPDLRSMYIILLTAKSLQYIMVGLDAGADDFVLKPFDRVELAARVRVGERVLSLQKQRVELDKPFER